MLATLMGSSIRLWAASTDPDTSVQSSLIVAPPDIGEFFINTTTGGLFLCYGNVLGSQIWQPATNSALILSIVAKNRSQLSPSRSLNNAFQISSTHDAIASYSVDVSTSLSLAGGTSGTVILEIASDAAFTLNVQQLGSYTNANTGALTIGLALTQIGTANLTGYVPASYYVRLRSVNNTGTPTFAFRNSQEVLL